MTNELKECREAFEKWAERELLVISTDDELAPLYAPNHTVWLAYQDAWQQSRTKPEGVDISRQSWGQFQDRLRVIRDNLNVHFASGADESGAKQYAMEELERMIKPI